MAHWGYEEHDGPQNWHKSYPHAAGNRQSPIDVKTAEAQYDAKLGENSLNLSYDPKRTKNLVNNGHTFQVNIDATGHNLSGGPLDDHYQLVQFHAHWGKHDDVGAEHTIDGKQYAGEVHLVHWNTDKFSSVSEAIQNDRGIAVLGAFLKVGKAHDGFEKLIPFLKKVQNKDAQTNIEGGFDPSCLLPENKQDYWTYEGSLTTPPCYESVSFILFKDVVEVSEDQIKVLRELLTDGHTPRGPKKIVDNFRPLCSMNNRVVKASFKA